MYPESSISVPSWGAGNGKALVLSFDAEIPEWDIPWYSVAIVFLGISVSDNHELDFEVLSFNSVCATFLGYDYGKFAILQYNGFLAMI